MRERAEREVWYVDAERRSSAKDVRAGVRVGRERSGGRVRRESVRDEP